MLASLVQGILALFLTAHLESFRNSSSPLETKAAVLPVGLHLIALLNIVDMEEVSIVATVTCSTRSPWSVPTFYGWAESHRRRCESRT